MFNLTKIQINLSCTPMQAVHSSSVSSSYAHWTPQDWKLFLRQTVPASAEPSEVNSPLLGQVVDLLTLQEREIGLLPHRAEILARFPSNPANPLFYYQREAYLEAYNKLEFWKLLPGGADYLREQENPLAIAHELGQWMDERADVLALKELVIGKKNLTRLPSEIGRCVNLETVMVTNTPLTMLPMEFGTLPVLTHLFISRAPLRQLCSGFNQLQSLEKLHIAHTELENIDAIGELENLKQLNLTGNRIQRAPAATAWKCLELLFLDNNQIDQLPDSFYEQPYLQCLGLSANRLTEISARISQMVRLQRLFLGKNGLTTLPSSLMKMQALSTIDIKENRFEQLPPCLGFIASLTHLTFKGNPVAHKPAFLNHVWTDINN